MNDLPLIDASATDSGILASVIPLSLEAPQQPIVSTQSEELYPTPSTIPYPVATTLPSFASADSGSDDASETDEDQQAPHITIRSEVQIFRDDYEAVSLETEAEGFGLLIEHDRMILGPQNSQQMSQKLWNTRCMLRKVEIHDPSYDVSIDGCQHEYVTAGAGDPSGSSTIDKSLVTDHNNRPSTELWPPPPRYVLECHIDRMLDLSEWATDAPHSEFRRIAPIKLCQAVASSICTKMSQENVYFWSKERLSEYVHQAACQALQQYNQFAASLTGENANTREERSRRLWELEAEWKRSLATQFSTTATYRPMKWLFLDNGSIQGVQLTVQPTDSYVASPSTMDDVTLSEEERFSGWLQPQVDLFFTHGWGWMLLENEEETRKMSEVITRARVAGYSSKRSTSPSSEIAQCVELESL